MDAGRIFNTFAAAVPVLLVVVALWPVTDRELGAFTVRHSLPVHITSPSLPRAVARSRGMRLLGAAVGLSLPLVVKAFTHDSFDTGSALLWGAAGYLGGALAAALVPLATAGGARRGATLVPRRARAYLPLRTLALPGGTLTFSLLAALIYALAPRRPNVSPGTATLVGWLGLSVLAALVALVGTRLVVRRRQPAPDAEILAVDDALRTHGLHLIVGTAVAVGAVAASAVTFEVAQATSVQLLRWTLPLVGLAELLLALHAWTGRDGNGWRLHHRVHP